MICPNCGGEHNKPKFCSLSCAASYNNRAYPKRKRRGQGECRTCGGSLRGKQGKYYCSLQCQQAYQYQIFITEWLAGERRGGTDIGVSTYVRRWLRTQQKDTCTICGLNEWLGQAIGLICDHIDGNPTNHSRENLRMICGNCDMQLPTYKSKNKGNGRAYRRERYAVGKSY